MRRIPIDRVGGALARCLTIHGKAISMTTQGRRNLVPVELAVDPGAVLPLFLVAAESIWRRATGHGFGLQLEADPEAMFGHRLVGIMHGPFSAIMLTMLEAIDQATEGDTIRLEGFLSLWLEAQRPFRKVA